MNSRSILLIVAIVIVGLGATLLLLRSEPAPAADAEAQPGALDYPRGPHGARLLSGDDFQVEMTIYETGVEPHFRIYPLDRDGQPIKRYAPTDTPASLKSDIEAALVA